MINSDDVTKKKDKRTKSKLEVHNLEKQIHYLI